LDSNTKVPMWGFASSPLVVEFGSRPTWNVALRVEPEM